MNYQVIIKAKEAISTIDRFASQIPFATSKALNDTAKEVMQEIYKEMERVFDKPKPYTLKSLYARWSTKQNLEARVKIKDEAGKGRPATHYLAHHVYSGDRKRKRSEQWLEESGKMPASMYTAPGKGAQLDKYGNITGSQLTQILSVLKALPEAGYTANQTAASKKRNKKAREYFVAAPGDPKTRHLKPGVYERTAGGEIKPVLIWIKKPRYGEKLKFFDIANRVYDKVFKANYQRAMDYAISTIRFK